MFAANPIITPHLWIQERIHRVLKQLWNLEKEGASHTQRRSKKDREKLANELTLYCFWFMPASQCHCSRVSGSLVLSFKPQSDSTFEAQQLIARATFTWESWINILMYSTCFQLFLHESEMVEEPCFYWMNTIKKVLHSPPRCLKTKTKSVGWNLFMSACNRKQIISLHTELLLQSAMQYCKLEQQTCNKSQLCEDYNEQFFKRNCVRKEILKSCHFWGHRY